MTFIYAKSALRLMLIEFKVIDTSFDVIRVHIFCGLS